MAAAPSTTSLASLPSQVQGGRGLPDPAAEGAVVTVEESQVEIFDPEVPPPIEPEVPPPIEPAPPLNYYERMFLEKNPLVEPPNEDIEKSENGEVTGEATVPEETPPNEASEVAEQPEVPPHHMLDEYMEKVLTRSEQDALYAEVGKGKGRGKGKGGGKGKKGRGKGKDLSQGSAMKKKARKGRKDPVARVLFPSDAEEEQRDDGAPTGSPAAKSRSTSSYKRPAAAKAKASPGSKAKAKAKSKSKARGKEIGAVGDEKGQKKRRQSKTDDGDGNGKPKIVKQEIPTFQCSVVVPYWSRGACGLKVPPQKIDGEGGIASKNWRQVFYLGVRGASMKEHIDIIASIVTLIQ